MDLDLQVNLKFRLVVVLRESREHQQCYPILTTQAAEQSSKRPFGASFKIGIVTLWFHFKQFKGQIRTQRPKEDNCECELAHGRLEKVTLFNNMSPCRHSFLNIITMIHCWIRSRNIPKAELGSAFQRSPTKF